MHIMLVLLLVLIALIVGVVGGSIVVKRRINLENIRLNKTAADITDRAKRESSEIIKEAKMESKEIVFKGRQDAEKEAKEKRKEVSAYEKRVMNKEEVVDKKMETMDKKESLLDKRDNEVTLKEKTIEKLQDESTSLRDKLIAEIESVSQMTSETAKKILMDQMVEEARIESVRTIKTLEEEAKSEADKRSRSIIATAIQRCAPEYIGEITVSTVNLPSDDMKGRIIGREGRNIRAFETVTGVDVIVDDTPEAVILSSFDPYRREIARMTLEKLIGDGRIHPGRIEELFNKSTETLEKHVMEVGEETTFNLGIHNVPKEILRLIGRLKFRTSYGQNVLSHSMEVASIAGIMAEEVGLDGKMAKRCGLLHDIGKAIDYEHEGRHTQIGADIVKKHKESWKVANAIMSHHGEEDFKCIESIFVQAADAISASRPGARREVLESYIKRLEKLEEIASGFDGVSKSFAIQAGREVRIIVEPDVVNDDKMMLLSKDISKKVEEELTYPGQIKVLVIRESRSVEYAK